MAWQNVITRFASLLLVCALGSATINCLAVEGGLGHSVPGIWGGPKIGEVPSTPGLHILNSFIYYQGRGLQCEIGGDMCTDVHATIIVNYLGGTVIPKKQAKGRTYGYNISIPVQYTETSVQSVDEEPPGFRSGNAVDLGDVIIIPVILGWQKDNLHSAFRLFVFTRTGHFKVGQLGLTGDNTWTISPMFAQTITTPSNGWDFSYNGGLDFYTNNPATNYQSGTVFHIDLSAVRDMKNGWGIGAIYGWLQQINKDTGPMADELGGFRGTAMALGPIATYDFASHDRDVSMGFRVVREFRVRNRLRGWTLLWTTAFKW